MGHTPDVASSEHGNTKGVLWGRPVDKLATAVAAAVIAAAFTAILAFAGTRNAAFAVAWIASAAAIFMGWYAVLDNEDRRALTCPGYVGVYGTHARAVLAFTAAIALVVIFAGALTMAATAILGILL